MKKFVCTRVKFIEDRFVSSIAGDTVNVTEGKSMMMINLLDASFTEELSQSFAGKVITQVLHVSGEFGFTIANRLMSPVIFELTLDDGRKFIWGDKQVRAKAKSQNLSAGRGVMTFERKSPSFQL